MMGYTGGIHPGSNVYVKNPNLLDLEHKSLYKEEAIVDGIIPWNNNYAASVNFKNKNINIKPCVDIRFKTYWI